MNIKLLQFRIKLILPSTGKNWVAIRQEVDSLIENDRITEEDRINNVEHYLINCITWSENSNDTSALKICIKLILLHRGYFTDSLGILEYKLFELAFEKIPKMISERHHGNPWIAVLTQPFIIKILSATMPCFDNSHPLPERLWAVMKQILMLLDEHHDRLEHQYLEYCLSKVHEHKILTSTLEHSIWASAALESLKYLEKIIETLESYKGRNIQSADKTTINNRADTHLRRAKYFVQQCQLLAEPIGDYVDTHLSHMEYTIRRLKNKFHLLQSRSLKTELSKCEESIVPKRSQSIFEHQEKIMQNNSCVISARNFFTSHGNATIALEAARSFSQQLRKNDNPIGIFIDTIIDILTAPPTKSACKKGFYKLQNIVVPKAWRHLIGQLWLYLAEGLEQYQSEEKPYIAKHIKLILQQITPKYGEKIHLLARIQIARFHNNLTLVTHLTNELERYNEQHPGENLDEILPCYAKQHQYDYVYHLLHTEISTASDLAPSPMLRIKSSLRGRHLKQIDAKKESEQLCQRLTPLLNDDYPYGLEVLIHCLLEEPDTLDYVNGRNVVSATYGNKYTNPLQLCERKLEKQVFNRQLLIWTDIYINAQNNNTLTEQIAKWRECELNDTDIEYKIYNYARSMLFSGMNQDTILVPGSCELLMDIDKKLYEITMELMANIKRDDIENLFHFAKNHPGLLEASFAQLAEREHNPTLAALLAKSSISFATQASLSPRKPKKTPNIPSLESSPKVSRRKSASSRNASNSEINPEVFKLAIKKLTSPSHLGHLILVSSLWETKLKNKRNRDAQAITDFQENLRHAKNSPSNSEKEYIQAAILFHYFNSQFDELWLLPEELEAIGREFEEVKNSDRMASILGKDEKKQYFIIQKIKNHLENALNHDLYPPAAWMYAKDIYYFESFYLDGDVEGLNEFIHKTLFYLEKAITCGYLPALYLYAIIVKNNIDLFQEDGSLAVRLRLIKKFFDLSERYVFILPSQKKEFEELIQIRENLERFCRAFDNEKEANIRNTVLRHIDDNRQLASLARVNKSFRNSVQQILSERQKLFAEDNPCVMPLPFCDLKLPIKFTVNTVDFELDHSSFENGKTAKALKITGQKKELVELQYFFEQAQKLFSYTKQVRFLTHKPVIQNREGIIITHAEIATLGLVKLCSDFSFLNDSEVKKHTNLETLSKLLHEIYAFQSTIWQQPETYQRLDRLLSCLASEGKGGKTGSLKRPLRGSKLVLTEVPPNSPSLKPRRETSPRLLMVDAIPSPRGPSSRASSPMLQRKRHSTTGSGSANSLRRFANKSSLSSSPITALPQMPKAAHNSDTMLSLRSRSYDSMARKSSDKEPIEDPASLESPTEDQDEANKLNKEELEQGIRDLLTPRTEQNTRNNK